MFKSKFSWVVYKVEQNRRIIVLRGEMQECLQYAASRLGLTATRKPLA